MAISQQQLEIWSHQGAVTTSKATHEAIRRVLESDPILQTKDIEIYLQGSYKNYTNIFGDSDVDIVVQLNSTFSHDLSRLLPVAQQQFHAAYPFAADYTWDSFRDDVVRILRKSYGTASVEPRRKAIKLKAGSGRQPADVIPAIQHRSYRTFFGYEDQEFVEGIKFFAAGVRPVINFPKLHYENGTKKNDRAGGAYKRTVRMLKNARNRAVAEGLLAAGTAPSYFLECLLYNAPDICFAGSAQDAYQLCVGVLSNANLDNFACQSEQVNLFGESPEQWSKNSARYLLNALSHLWQGW